jgi:hypothetical protein
MTKIIVTSPSTRIQLQTILYSNIIEIREKINTLKNKGYEDLEIQRLEEKTKAITEMMNCIAAS